MSFKANIPDWQAYTKGFKHGKEDTPNLARLCSNEARAEYERGYADGREYAHANPPPPKPEGKQKESAMLKEKFPPGPSFTVSVTEAIITHARIRDSSHCMIAMAIRDVKPEMTSIAVDLQTIRFSDPAKGYRYSYLTPRIAQKALVDYDQGDVPEPFSFRLGGAHVTRMVHKPKGQTPREMTPGQQEALAKMRNVKNGNKAGIVLEHENNGEQPRRVGGALPPMSNFARRREFGIKALRM